MSGTPRPAHAFVHRARLALAAGTDVGAPGAAVTLALCGHWEHEGPCRWPHHNEATPDGREDGARCVELRCVVAADKADEEVVRTLVYRALRAGGMEGPDGPIGWRMLDSGPGELTDDELVLAERLARPHGATGD